MSLFKYQGQEEDHYTNILMNILSIEKKRLVKPFLQALLPQESNNFEFNRIDIRVRKKDCPQDRREYEYIIGIAPYEKAIDLHKPYEENLSSIPDAWICGENFNLLFEFKIRGTLDENQIAAHKKLLGTNCEVIRLKWTNIKSALQAIKLESNSIENYLINEFLKVTPHFKSKRKSSGMPKEIISNINKENEFHFIITGGKRLGPYKLEKVFNGKKTVLNDKLQGIQAARKWISTYVFNNHSILPIEFEGMNTIISDYCVLPGRPEKKNQWNQWKLGAYIDN
jgi:hypothetical protein